MAIPTFTSQELNNILTNANNNISEIDKKIEVTRKDISKKLQVLKYETEYLNRKFNTMQAGGYNLVKNMKILANMLPGQYESYGSTIHAKFIKSPINVFNLKVSGMGQPYFRSDVKVKVNDIESDKYKSILKHELIPDKDIFFEEFSSNIIKLTIEVDTSNMLGPTKFNMLEIDPFLPGSFDIDSVEIYTLNEDGQLNTAPEIFNGVTLKYKNVGKERILLPRKVNLYKVIFNLKVNYEFTSNSNKVYPFGLKHLFFYDADFRTDSFVMATIQESNNIAVIKNKVTVLDPSGEYEKTISSSSDGIDIQIFLDYINGMLETPVYPSTDTERNEILRNTKTLYTKISLNKPLIGVGFKVETRI